jgi:D-alanyl-D-alanine carboxypeptidase/D-alanyl-D-alanine-endopeptidase (penicillin-binding protein 4)
LVPLWLALLLAPWAGLACPAAAQAQPAQAAVPAASALAQGIRRIIEAPRFAAATWGIQVVSLDTGRVLFAHNAGKAFIPASNAKLFTVAMALQELGPERRLRTSLYAAARPGPDGILAGDLVLYGRGDPTLMRPWTGGPPRPDPLEDLVRQLQAQGVRSIQGDLVGDDSCFDAPPFAPGWAWEDLRFAYGAEPTALTIHHNVVDLWVYPAAVPGRPCFLFAQPGHGLFTFRNDTRTRSAGAAQGVRADRTPGESTLRVSGSLAPGAAPVRLTVTIHDGALFAARLLERALARHGIPVLGRVRSVHAREPMDTGNPMDPMDPMNAMDPMEAVAAPAGRVELGHLDSPPVRALVRDLMKESLNPYAQLLLLQAGNLRPGGPGDSVQRGLAVLADWMARAGLDPGSVQLEDGAGGSRRNLVQPDAIVRLLAHMDRQPEAAAFRDSLPVAGVDGTLRLRMEGTAAQGNLRAKTGTLRGTHALSGYVTSAGGERLAFAILLNNDPDSAAQHGPSAQAGVDAVAELLAQDPGPGTR